MDITAVVCPNCGDTWNKDINYNYKDITDCHRCHKDYAISENTINMFDWVFWKVKTVKGEG